MSAEGARFLHAPVQWGGVTIASVNGELLEPVSELGVAKPELYERLLGGVMPSKAIADTIVLGSD